jgi:uncharacterized membrane protein YraQ (UPF0718 family)
MVHIRRRGKHLKKTMTFLSKLLGIGAIGMFLLAGALNLSFGWTIGLVMLIVAALVALVIAFIDGNEGDNIGSYRMPRT